MTIRASGCYCPELVGMINPSSVSSFFGGGKVQLESSLTPSSPGHYNTITHLAAHIIPINKTFPPQIKLPQSTEEPKEEKEHK